MKRDLAITPALTPAAEQLLEDLAESLEIPASRYEAAERSYQSVGRWLDRPESSFSYTKTTIYPQGSFRLGTVIRPLNGDEDYDLDVVCEVAQPKAYQSQAEFKRLLGKELRDYSQAHGMNPPEEARRCWTLNYADGAQFHMDVLPAVPDGMGQRRSLAEAGLDNPWADDALAITDITHTRYHVRSEDWPQSNPKGYSAWFRGRMQMIFVARRKAMALEKKAAVEDIPEYRVKTPLQAAIQILKRHRDVRFAEDPELRPISIILTTLAAHAYAGEVSISAALFGILSRMDHFIENRNGVPWIPNPAAPRENFADKWREKPAKEKAFRDWLVEARADFWAAAQMQSVHDIVDVLTPRMGRGLLKEAAERRLAKPGLSGAFAQSALSIGSKLRRILGASHRQAIQWPALGKGTVVLDQVQVYQNGFRPASRSSDGAAVPKHCSLFFEARTNVQAPYKVYWQVVNTGDEASRANGLRGGFDEGVIEQGKLVRRESTLYSGHHSIQCFVVKDGYCVAQSEPFIVNIA